MRRRWSLRPRSPAAPRLRWLCACRKWWKPCALSRVELIEHMHPETPVDLVPITRQVVDGLQMLALDRNVEIELAQPVGPVMVAGYRDELTRVFENLIENALKYGGSGKRVEIG